MEHKGELDNIRILYARMQAQLDETHKLLHEEHRKRFKSVRRQGCGVVWCGHARVWPPRQGKTRTAPPQRNPNTPPPVPSPTGWRTRSPG